MGKWLTDKHLKPYAILYVKYQEGLAEDKLPLPVLTYFDY